MGLLDLGQALAQFDQLKRRVGLLASNPSEFAAGSSGPELGNAGSYPGGLLSVMPQVREQAINEALKLTPGLLGATVYHGSPYQFEKFDASKIGTGEGAQAYGYGHYVAENPKVAQQYRANLTAMQQGRFEGGNQNALTNAEQAANNVLASVGWDKAKALQSLDATIANAKEFPKYSGVNADRQLFENEWLAKLRDAVSRWSRNEGATYKIDLPDEAIAKMLDWDKPLSQQPEAVRNAFGNIGGDLRMSELASLRDPNVAAQLSQMGIPGIKYLDRGSRAAGQGTMNYVIFPGNEGLLKILGRE